MSEITDTNRMTKTVEQKENERVVQFKVPESVFNRAKAKAHLTGVPWKAFLQNLMEEGVKLGDADTKS